MTNIASASGGGATSPTDTETVTAVQNPKLSLVKTATPTTYDSVGDVIGYSYELTNSGNVTLSGPFTVSDDKSTVDCSLAAASLAPGDVAVCTASYTITQGDLDVGSVTNTARAKGKFNGSDVFSNEDSTTITANQTPKLTQTKVGVLDKTVVAPNDRADAGDVINYTITATNAGNVTLTNVTVVDPLLGTLSCTPTLPATLLPGASIVCTGSYTLLQSDINAGERANTATADSNQTPPTETPNVVPVPQDPKLTQTKVGVLDKTVVAPNDRADAGDEINYTITATNAGNVTLTNVTVVDPLLGTLSCTPTQPATLLPGASVVCTGSYTLLQSDINAGERANTATADSNQTPPTETPNVVPVPQDPKLAIVKTATPGTYSAVGNVISYSYLVSNNGNVTLSGPFTVSDDKATDESCPVTASLAPGASITCTASYTISQADLNAGSVTNVASASNGTVTSPTDTETVTAVQTKALTIVKTAAPTTYSTVGTIISYSYLVTNSGNVTLAGPVTVADDKATVTCPAGGLAPLASMTCTASYTIVPGDITAGTVTNTAYAKSGETQSLPDSETVTFANIPPDLSVTKTANPTSVPETGGSVTFTFAVINNAAEAATITSLSDSKFGTLTGDTDCQVGATLAANGGSCSFTATFPVPASDLLGSHANTFTAVATDPEGFADTATADATVTYTDVPPTVTLDKSVDVEFLDEPGGDFTFMLTIHNTSWEEVTITALTDTQSGAAVDFSACAALIDRKLAAGASTSCSYVVSHTDVAPGGSSYENTASVTVTDNDGSPASASASQMVLGRRFAADRQAREIRRPDHAPRARRRLQLHAQDHQHERGTDRDHPAHRLERIGLRPAPVPRHLAAAG